MASASLGEELSCSICLSLYTEPVTLTCGHSFCRDCIVTVLDKQKASGKVFSPPECREEYPNHPLLEKNSNLSNIVDNVTAMQQEKAEVRCMFCVDAPVPAVKTCQRCEISMCDKHLAAHNETVDHVLVEPTSSLISKKCSIHKKLLEYYCTEDSTCLCVSCCLVGTHKGHKVELLEEASEKKKEGLRHELKKMAPKRGRNEERIQSLQDHKRKAQEKAADEKKRVTALFEDIRRQLEVQEMKVLNEIARQEEQISQSVSDCIRHLETQGGELSRKMACIEKMCNMTDPIAVLQDPESETADQDMEEPSVPDLDDLIVLELKISIKEVITQIESQVDFPLPEKTHLLLDVDTANYHLELSDDFKTAVASKRSYCRPYSQKRFITFSQVMSCESFSSGRHYWEVEVSDYGEWDVGVSYSSIEREGEESGIGNNKKSWSYRRFMGELYAIHDYSEIKPLNPRSNCGTLGIYLNYDAGRLSFFQLEDPFIHLHTFTATFTEPLHAAFYVNYKGWVRIFPYNCFSVVF
ncbi:E3 ubiquitin/ISG15 ligase TRIM25-like isoform X1 [Hyperolius riggenbachi]|uniref:E3 ubiquitin/ISG15 ligase TRIM25-like isoform X1 n=1 Tax=Hyperolius riggenbachi TaxID=752182 RepID=UPI0035A2C2C4